MILPQGNIADPEEAQQLEWFYLTFPREHHQNYITAGRTLENDTMENLTEFMRIQRKSDIASGRYELIIAG